MVNLRESNMKQQALLSSCCIILNLLPSLFVLCLALTTESEHNSPRYNHNVNLHNFRQPQAAAVSPSTAHHYNVRTSYQPNTNEPAAILPSADQDSTPSYDDSTATDVISDDGTDQAANNYLMPQDLAVIRLNNTSVVLHWEIDNQAFTQLQYFLVQHKSKKSKDWITDEHHIPPTTKAYQINGLRPGEYLFTVVAVYSEDSVTSEELPFKLRAKSKISKEEMPNQEPPEIFWHDAQPELIRFKWKYAVKDKDQEDGSFGYLVYYRSAHSVSDFSIYKAFDESVELADLEPETPYEAKVVAFNNVTVSKFSNTITIKTPPVTNDTLTTTTTTSPLFTGPIVNIIPTSSPPPFATLNKNSTTVGKPSINTQPANHKNNSTVINQTIISPKSIVTLVVELLMGNQNDTTVFALRYSIIILLVILFITFILICVFRHRRKPSTPPASPQQLQFDLEINYFKNSFPAMDY